MIVINDYVYVFDEVLFGIDVREWRLKHGYSQQQVADMLDYTSGSSVSAIERGRMPQHFSMQRFILLVNLMDKKPSFYFDVQLSGA